MSIRKPKEWTGQKSTGYIDFGGDLDSAEVPEAKEVLLFMPVVINGRWKISVAYLLINGLTVAPQNLNMVETIVANLSSDCLET